MRFPTLALLILAPLALAASPIQAASEQLTFAADEVKESVRHAVKFDGDDDICPDLKVRCVIKDGENSKVVGDVSFGPLTTLSEGERWLTRVRRVDWKARFLPRWSDLQAVSLEEEFVSSTLLHLSLHPPPESSPNPHSPNVLIQQTMLTSLVPPTKHKQAPLQLQVPHRLSHSVHRRRFSHLMSPRRFSLRLGIRELRA